MALAYFWLLQGLFLHSQATTTTATTSTTTTYNGGTEITFTILSCGADYTLAATTDGTPLTWGFPLSERPKVYVPQGFLWKYMKGGTSHSCGITNEGRTFCWGRTREGQCDVPPGYSFQQLTLGEAHTCGITEAAELLCWGSPTDNGLVVPPGHTWSQVAAGTVSTCGVNTTGSILCWGRQGYGRREVPYLDNADVRWQEVACGDRHCCAILTVSAVQALSRRQEDNVLCWGDDFHQQLQVPGKEQGRTGGQESFRSISAGTLFTCGLTQGSEVWCWGRVAQYGLNFRTPKNATLLSAGGIHACILDVYQKAHCWGGNTEGQADVPLDSDTYPPSIVEFANDPLDISEEDPSIRLKEYIPGYSQPARTNQHITMAIFFPEFAMVDTPTLTFEYIDGPEDPYSPHVIKFPDSWNAPVINELKISAFDLSLWYDVRLGPSPAVRNITSTWVNGTTKHQLVDGAAYSVKLAYQDTFAHPAATHWIQRYEVTYDLETLPPTLWAPMPGFTKQALAVGYSLPEDMYSEAVWITMTFTGTLPGYLQQVEDSQSPYEIQLVKEMAVQGNYSFEISLGALYETLDGRRSPYVRRVFTAGGVGGPDTRLATGGRYNMTLRVADRFNNAPKFDEVSPIDFIWDTATELVQVHQPSTSLNDPIVIDYTITEPMMAGSCRFALTWLRNVPTSGGVPQADLQSPHVWYVTPAKERDVASGASSNIIRLSASNLFRDSFDEALAHPDIPTFESTGTPVYSRLQPFSEYELSISCQDVFQNPRSYVNLSLQTNFTPPSAPHAPTLYHRTTTTLVLAWLRGNTGGLRITKFDVQLQVAPEPEAGWTGSDAEAASAAASVASGQLQEKEVNEQESNRAVFLDLSSSQHYLARVRAWNMAGVSPWSAWSLLRVLSSCADGHSHDAEECDDGNMVDGDGCSTSCKVELGWTCEAQPLGLYADGWGRGPSKCRASGIDGLRVGDEECDDCNLQAGDGCDNGRVEPGYTCDYKGRLGIESPCPGVLAADTNNYLTFTADSCHVTCGDGIRHIVAGEECDDGNVINGDGCTSDCRIEPGYECPTIGWPAVLLTPCRPICGDGLRRGTEACDDNNTVAGDGCWDCKVEIGWFCKRIGEGEGEEVCRNTCLNGDIDPGEDCDDANTFDNDGCSNCIIEQGWTCEAIANRPTSTGPGSFCTPICGDGLRIELGTLAEQCDDGNFLAGDGCSPDCQVEPGWQCVVQANSTALRCEQTCGDGLLAPGEQCDDGNKELGDGCDNLCRVERGFVCTPEDAFTKSEVSSGPPFAAQNRTVCQPICGDGLALLSFGEACDDGNRVPSDGCDESCQVEAGYTCGTGEGVTAGLSLCTPICGDSLLRAPEQCDDGNAGKGDGCDETCQLEQGYQCWPPGVACRPLCGDSLRLEGEACDDGNLQLEDGCDSSCQVEDGWACRSYIYAPANTTSVCSPICGDGKLRGGEACDDGNLVQGDGCDQNCAVEDSWVCCDPAPGTTGSKCSPGFAVDRELICGAQTCGDGRRDDGEGCDDGNNISADGCSPRCEVDAGYACTPMAPRGPGRYVPDHCEAICGDGLLVQGEECDDGNQVSGDGCGWNCKIEQLGTSCPQASDGNGGVCRATCGDGVRGPVEECDDGNSFGGDGCSASCQIERGFTCSGGGLRSMDTCWPICGDGLRVDRAFSSTLAADKLEACDTGPTPSRGCDISTCTVRAGWTCSRPAEGSSKEVCTPICGDGILMTPMEECDDNNNQPGDGCSPDCKVEPLYECAYDDFWLRSVCSIRCGDGRRHPSEACDDGNNWDQDGCSSTCQPEPGFECHGGTLSKPSQCRPICGDGFEVLGESCDDGNLIPWDGCNQFCQVEAGYYCTKAPRPENPGSPSQCTNSCGDGIVNGNEECDDGIAEGSESATCSKCRRLPAAVCGDFRCSASEQCDDGNTVTGDGCSPSCEVEPGWTCTQGPQHLDPGTGPGDSCAPVCGDGLVIAGLEACDDGNLRGDDGCTADCQVEPLFQCFLLGASELSQVPAAVQPVRGPDASICVPTTPPRLVGAYFGEALVTLKLNFDTKVAPLPGEEYVGGVALAAASFPCNVLLAESTLLLLGTQPSCWWESRSTAAVALGGSPGLAPGSSVVLKAGVLRRYIFTQEASPSQELKADVPGGFIAPVLWPQPVITGPQMVPSCADSTTLSSEHSQGLAGRMPLPNRWDVVAAFNIKNGTWDDKEVQRIRTGIASQAQSTEVTFPRQGAVLSLLDLEFDRSLRVNYLYRICLTQQNLLGLSGVACHHLEVNDFPVPSVAPVAPSTRYVIPKYGRWLNLETTADIPKGCLAGDAPLPTTFLAREVPKASHDLSVEEPMVRAGWAYDASMRNVGQERATLRTPSVAQPLGEDRWGNRSVLSQIFVPPGTLAAGFADVLAVACINASTNLSLLEMSLGMPSYEQVCGYYTFRVHVVDVATGISLSERPARRLNVTEAALARAELRLVGLAPELGLAPQGPPLQADESRPWALQRLEVLQDLSGNQLRADFLQYGWLGAIEPENSTTVLGAVLALTNDTEFTQSQLQAALAEFTPLVTWSVQAETRSGAQVVAEPLTPSVGGVFLSLPPGQLSSGSQVQVTAQLDLLPGLGCSAVRSLQKQATLRVNLPPAAGYLLVDRTRVAAPAPLMSFIVANMRWSSAALPLQYRLEAELPTGLLLSDWSFDPKVPVAFLPRDQTLVLRGQARDGRGTVAVTAPETVQLMASATAEAQALRVLAAFQQGQMLFAQYSPRKTSETLSLLQSTASSLDPMLQWQLWQDVAFSALSTRFDSSVQNCTEDCGAHGSCFVSELLDQSWDRCTCADGWLGSRCELRDFEAESQKLVTLAVLDALQKLATQLEVLGINSVAGSLGRFFQLLRRVADDCRRVPLDGLASLVGIAAGLAAQAPKAALRDARVEMTALISQLYSCLPEEDPSMPMASMPAPATVLLTSLGSSEICRPVNGTNTTVCYDLASSEVRMSCPGTAQKAYQGEVLSNPSAAAVQSDVHCRADLNLGIADPYPCPCPLPDSTFLGFGRSERQPLLSETLGARDEKDILWRELVRLFWNNTKYGGSGVRGEQPGPVLAAALWLQETGAAANEVTSALAEAERWQLVQQGILMALQSMAPLLADALLGAAVPGQEPHLVESQPVDMHWAVPTVMSTDGPPSRTWVAAMSLDTPTQVETEYQTLDPVSGPQPQTLPVKVPLGAVHWKNGGRGLFSKIDPSVKVHSDVVQLRLLEASRYNLTKLRYRFKVPDLQPRCVPPTEDLLLLCCNASNWTDRPGAFAFACPTFSSPLPVANPARRVASTAGTPAAPIKVASVLELSGQRLPFEQGLESLMQDVQLWTQDQVLIAGSHLRMRGGDLKVVRACDSRGNAASRLILREGRMLEQPSVGFHSDAWCRAVFARAEAKRASALSWQTFQDLLLEAAHEVLADPLLIPSSTTSTISRTTTSTSTSSSHTTSSSKTSTSTTTVSTRSTTSMTETRTSSTRTFSTVTSTTTTTGNGTFFTGTSTTSTTSTSSSTSSNTTSSTSSTRTSSSTSSSSEANIFSGVNSTTTTSSTRTTRTSTSTTVVFCVGGEPPQIDTWCPSGVTSEDYLPVYADVELLDPDGILLFGVSAVQLSLNESTSLAMSMPGGKITMLAPTRSIYFVHAMAIIYDFWVSWQELHELANVSQVLRPWRPELPTSTVTSTTTFTSTSATSTTSTNTPGPFPQLQPSSSAVLGALEIAFSDPLEVLSRALAFELQNSDGTARSTSEGSWAERGLAASDLLSSWCQVPSLAPAVLSDIFASLDPVVGSDSMRPLQSMLQSLDEGLPSWWNESFWAESAGGPDWQPPIPQTTTPATQTRTSTTAVDLRSFLCPEVDCLPPDDCGVDPLADLECVAWSAPLRRFVPALGCELVAEPGRRWPLLQSGYFEMVCECAPWALHPAMAIAEKRPELTPFPPQVTIQTREFVVPWWDKVNRYNLRGFVVVIALVLLAALHSLIAAVAEVRWRMQARFVAMHAARKKGVQKEVEKLEIVEKEFIKRRTAEIRATGEFSAAIMSAEAEATLRQAEGLPHASITQTSLDLRQAKDGLATLFQAHGLGDVEEDVVKSLALPGAAPPPLGTLVTGTLSKATPSVMAVPPPPPASAGARSPVPMLSLRDTAREEPFHPEEAMISTKAPTKPRRSLRDVVIDALRRCRRKHIWRACHTHHKIFSLSDDTQTWAFSAPERAAVLHFSLWTNAACLAVALGGATDRRPFQDPFCPGAGSELTWAEAGCLVPPSSLGAAALAALWAMPMAAGLQTLCRGRSFLERAEAADLSAAARERAFTRHFLGPWPAVLMAPGEAKVRLWNCFCSVASCCRCRCCPRPKRQRLLSMHWQPSLVPLVSVLMLLLLAWSVCHYMFFFSSSVYMYEEARSDTTVMEILYPPDERAEVAAASIDGWRIHLVLVPELQRFLALLVISCLMNLFIFEPLSLILHLIIGEPTLSEFCSFVAWTAGVASRALVSLGRRLWSPVPRIMQTCFPDERRAQVWRLWDQYLGQRLNQLGQRISKLGLTQKLCCCCRRQSEVAPVAPEDIKETVESEGEDEAPKKKQKGRKK